MHCLALCLVLYLPSRLHYLMIYFSYSTCGNTLTYTYIPSLNLILSPLQYFMAVIVVSLTLTKLIYLITNFLRDSSVPSTTSYIF